jgi:serine/threonine-protein kinase RsbW
MPEKPQKMISLLIDSKFKNISVASLTIRGVARHLALSDIDTYYLELCVMEAINNAIQHAYAGEEGHIVDVNIAYTPGEIIVKVSDTGKTMTMYVPKRPDFDPENIKTVPDHGLGLYIMHTVMDEITYETSGTINTLTMRKVFYKS